jgi:16S rRNA G966 N2-methylase RsmD
VGTAVACATVVAFVPLRPGATFVRWLGEDARVATWESWEATTIVLHTPDAPPPGFSAAEVPRANIIVTNGRSIRWNVNGPRRDRFFRTLPAKHPRVLLVGFGTGSMAAEALRIPGLASLTLVEIDGAQFQAAPWFGAGRVLDDPRVTVVVDDALHFLDHTTRRFDFAIVDAWGPPDSAALYTTTFHERVRQRLAEGGILWSKFVPMDEASTVAVIDAARCTWKHVAFITPGRRAFVSSDSPLPTATTLTSLDSDRPCEPLTHLRPRRLWVVEAGPEDGAHPPIGREHGD